MRVRVLYFKRTHPRYAVGTVCDMPPAIAQEYLSDGAGEPVRGVPHEAAVAPPAAEVAMHPAPVARAGEAEVKSGPVAWPLKTKAPEDYIAEHGDKPPDDLSPSVAENLALARELVEGT